MRAVFLLILGLVIGGGASLYANRVEPSKSLIERHVAPVIDRLAPPPPPDPLPQPPLTLAQGETALTGADLAAFGVQSCFPQRSRPALSERPWLTPVTGASGLFDRGALARSPDLANYPGLIKIEGIRAEDGSEREHCAAVRVAEHWFLTAAHCLVDLSHDASKPVYDVIAITPSHDVRQPKTEIVSLTGAVCHAAYGTSRRQYPNDIALFYLEDVSAFEEVEIAELERSAHGLVPSDFRRTYIAGWGKNGGTRYLQGGPVAMVEAGEAVLIGERIGLRGPNVGDSGAPLYLARDDHPLVIGTLSQVTQDANENGHRSIYVRAKAMQDWITRTMMICEQNDGYICAPPVPVSDGREDNAARVADSL